MYARCTFWLLCGLVSVACVDKVERVCETNASCITEQKTVCYLGRCRPRVCTPGSHKSCYPDAPTQRAVGACRAGIQLCQRNGSAWSSCVGYITAIPEICDGKDNDCDGKVDEELKCACLSGTSRPCYTGAAKNPPLATPCRPGIQYCSKNKLWGQCQQQLIPGATVAQYLADPTQEDKAVAHAKGCRNTDSDCDGQLDEGIDCPCQLGSTRPCYTGPPNTAGKGICKMGTQTCIQNAAEQNHWGLCEKQILPQPEEIDGCNGKDDDCNGVNDNQSGTNAILWKPCGEAQECKLQICQQEVWSLCQQAEICNNQIDNDCDGMIDEKDCIKQ